MSKISRLAVLTGIAAASDTGNYFYTAAMPEREPKQNKGSPGAKNGVWRPNVRSWPGEKTGNADGPLICEGTIYPPEGVRRAN